MSQVELDRAHAHKTLIRRLFVECINEGHWEMADQLISADFVNAEGGTGPDGFRASVTPLRRAFPDIRFTIHDLVAEGDRVAVRWTWEGTHRAAFAGVPATGKRIVLHGNVIYRIRDGMIAEAWAQPDRLGMLEQLGTVPPQTAVAGTRDASSGGQRNEAGSSPVRGSR
jgi:steroid delta-isomerase-like uncharacterized protein